MSIQPTTTAPPSGAPKKCPVLLRRPEGHSPQAIGVIDAADLVRNYQVPTRNTRAKIGYQRPVSATRVNKLAADLKGRRVDLPTAVLLNDRGFDTSTLEDGEFGQAWLDLNGSDLFVVDGQHRIAALEKLVDEDPDRWEGYPIPFVCMLGADEGEEMEQFYVVNSTAKNVRTDLAFDLLKQRAENDPELQQALVQKGEDWKVVGQDLAERLDKTKLWSGCIRFPGEPKASTVIASSGMVNSLKQLLATPYFSQISIENKLKILDAYWAGIQRVIPEAFDEPTEYTLQKSTGVMIMHALLISVIELLRSQGKSVLDPQAYEGALRETLVHLEGDTASGEVAKGADFWLSGTNGAAGSFSSNAGRRVLSARLKADLPEVEVE